MKLNNLLNNIIYDNLLKDELINFLFNNYKENNDKVPIKLNPFMIYNIRGKKLVFIGTFNKNIENTEEIIVMYVFLEKMLNLKDDNVYVPSIYSCYELFYFSKHYESYFKNNITILTNSQQYNKLFNLIKNK